MTPFVLTLALLVTHGLAWAVGWLVGYDRALQRTNREWGDKEARERVVKPFKRGGP